MIRSTLGKLVAVNKVENRDTTVINELKRILQNNSLGISDKLNYLEVIRQLEILLDKYNTILYIRVNKLGGKGEREFLNGNFNFDVPLISKSTYTSYIKEVNDTSYDLNIDAISLPTGISFAVASFLRDLTVSI